MLGYDNVLSDYLVVRTFAFFFCTSFKTASELAATIALRISFLVPS